MTYCINEGKEYEICSIISDDICDSCKNPSIVQELPAEYNTGELYTVKLCILCLNKLGAGLVREHIKRGVPIE